MPYQVDTWGGDLHQTHVETSLFEDWTDAQSYMRTRIDAGLLCNVLDTDFKTPANRVHEAFELIVDYAAQEGKR